MPCANVKRTRIETMVIRVWGYAVNGHQFLEAEACTSGGKASWRRSVQSYDLQAVSWLEVEQEGQSIVKNA